MARKITSLEKSKFEELRALKVLQLIFPEKYRGATLSEAPDIVNEEFDIGVEVTSSMKRMVRKGHAIISKFSGKRPAELKGMNFTRMRAMGISIFTLPTGEICGSSTHWGNCHDLVAAYCSKTETLNKPHFSVFAENNLFIVAWLIDRDELNSGVSFLIDNWYGGHKQRPRFLFDNVYILKQGGLIEINLKKSTVKDYQIGTEQMYCISHSAFKEIIGVSRDEYYKC